MLGPTPAWRGQPVFVVKRTEEAVEILKQDNPELADPMSENPEQQPAYAQNEWRSTKPEIGIYVGLCTHLGCSPKYYGEIQPEPFDSEWQGGFFCPCHGSRFDMAGRVVRGVPAPTNLPVASAHLSERHGRADRPRTRRRHKWRSSSRRRGRGKTAAAWYNFVGWIDERFPLTETFEYHMSRYYAPKNFNFWYFFGVLSLVVLVIQLLTGIWLTMNYQPSGLGAFESVEYIMRDVEYGWLLRYLHSTGASAFFVVVYLHMFRGLMYGSYRKPRELLWLIGMAIFCRVDGGRFLRVPAALGQHVVLGRAGHRLAGRRDPVRGTGSHGMVCAVTS